MATYPIVKHKRLGRGKLLRVLQDGAVWDVLFASGRRYTLPSREFEPLPVAQPISSFAARRTIETLRAGIVPVEHIEDLTIGLSNERKSLLDALNHTRVYGGAVRAILANYGCGKTHFLTLAEQIALRHNFLVATISVDARELPPSQAKRVYQAALESLRYPDTPERGLEPLLQRACQQPKAVWEALNETEKGEDCPFATGVGICLKSQSDLGRSAALYYLSNLGSVRNMPRLFTIGNVARQYTYLLSGISALANALGYSGLVLLIDEVDYYSRLTPAQKERADNLFKALICASQGEDGTTLNADAIPDHDRVRYPLRFSDRSSLCFMFATTEAEQQIPVSAWLSPALLIRFDGHFSQSEIAHFLKMVGIYHAQAFDYELAMPEDAVPRLAQLFERALRDRRSEVNVRLLSQVAVTFYDLLHAYPERSADQRIRELARALYLESVL
jgi:hypothetical protein